MPSKHEVLVRYVAEDLLSGLKPVTVKRMFGGHGFYSGGRIFAIEADGEIFFKVNALNRADYEKAGSRPFRYSSKDRKAVTMSYWSVPDEVLEDRELATEWAKKSVHASM